MPQRPNVIHVYADDLGRGMLSCYGQKQFETPNIDRIAAAGTRFDNAYSCVLCAPARASLLNGRHDCHAGAWTFTAGNVYTMMSSGQMAYDEVREVINNTGIQAGPDDVFLAQLFKQAGYATGEVGKLEWGFATTPERMARHGWDYHYGYYDHCRCHGFYPPFLFENGEKVDIPGNTHADCAKHPQNDSPENHAIRWDMAGKAVYSQDLFDEKILAFIRAHADEPFFLFHPSQLPHGPTSIPEIHPAVKDHPELTPFEQEYASMVLRLDKTVGLILDELETLGIADNTIVIFSADNGHAIYYREQGRTGYNEADKNWEPLDNITQRFTSESCGDVFDGNDGMSGLKRSNWEGGARVPWLVSWPGHTPAGSVSTHTMAAYDLLATAADLLGADLPPEKDGVSFLPTITGRTDEQLKHDCVAYAGIHHGPSLVTDDGWKIRRCNHVDVMQLYYLPDDYQERNDLAAEHPDKLRELAAKLLDACDGDYANGHINEQRVAYAHEGFKQHLAAEKKRRQARK